VLDYVHCEWEDDHRQGETMWSFGPEIALLFGAQLEMLARVLETLIVKPENMLRNLDRTGGAVLYVSGEESERQIKLRGERLGISGGGLFLMGETSLERILEEVETLKPAALVVDSVQTIYSARFPSAPGSISQVREVATQLLFLAKGRGITTFLIGHVTKDGGLAGPKSLEHIVDTVLYFEGERRQHHRIVRAVKNRFGAVSEMGVFEMTAGGLRPVANPSKLFLSERPQNAPGSAVLNVGTWSQLCVPSIRDPK
jgi:DNA repair protein RadA/Sms